MSEETKTAAPAASTAATTTTKPAGDRPAPSGDRPQRPGGGGGRPPFRGRPGGGRPGGRPGGGRSFTRKKSCRFCKHPDIPVNYKDAKALRPFLTDKGKIMPRRVTGNCAKHQRTVQNAIKRARNMAIIPYTTISL